MRRVALTTAAAFAALTTGAAHSAPETAVSVRLGAGAPRLSITAAPVGPVAFTIRNTGRVRRSFAIRGARTALLAPGRGQTLKVELSRAGTYPWSVSTRTGIVRRGRFRAIAPAAPDPTPSLTELGRFEAPTDVDFPPGDPTRVVVVEQGGLVRLLVDGEVQESPFLDLRDRVLSLGEAGLLSIAFDPAFAETGLAYVFYNDRAGNINVIELRRHADDPNRLDPSTARTLLHEVKFAPNHNGGKLQFAADGWLYVSIGDGGSSETVKPGARVQSGDTLWGKLLRLDPATGTRTEVARGFRNPWRFWLDEVTGETWIADVGQDRREEINVIPASASGLNFGWPCLEGTLPFDADAECGDDLVAPLFEYEHGDDACSVTGGVVARDARLPQLDGLFLFADFCGGALRGLRRTSAGAELVELGLSIPRPTAFGTDPLGRVHVTSAAGGVFRLDAL
jgi:glucose/arabinose dehydrogenase